MVTERGSPGRLGRVSHETPPGKLNMVLFDH